MAVSDKDYEVIVNLSHGISAKDAVAQRDFDLNVSKVQDSLELDDDDMDTFVAVLSNSDKVEDVLKVLVELASVSSTYGSSNPGGRPKSVGSISSKTKMHNAFPKPKKPRKMKTKSAFPTPSQNRSNLKKALKLAYDMGYTDFNPDTLELSDREFSAEVRSKYSAQKKAMPGGSFPIPDKDALRRAIQSFGRAKPEDRERVKAHIKRRAKALGCESMLPESWK